MITYKTVIKKFASKGEKTGWTYIEIPNNIAEQLNPNCKKSFRIKGTIDTVILKPISILPMGDGNFILPLNLQLRKQIKKQIEETVTIVAALENKEYELNEDFVACLNDDPNALKHFKTLNKGHQNYFSKWIEAAKTNETKTNRIVRAINALTKGWGYVEMIRNKTIE